ncbi:MAG TPA: hypothetical protein VLL82_03875, partial [Mycobacterium sp.]|nr:hypothetical protein [Mycobacterium sp.]
RQTIDETYGSLEGYLRDSGITAADVDRLRNAGISATDVDKLRSALLA